MTSEIKKGSEIKDKKCNSCGLEQKLIPMDAREQKTILGNITDGFFWECKCGSTMFKRVNVKE